MTHNTENDIRAVCEEIASMLIEKNRSYGDSALTPVRIFSKEASPVEQLNVRMDDKLSRLLKGDAKAFGEDVEKDLIGYLILKRVALRRQQIEKAVTVPGRYLEPETNGPTCTCKSKPELICFVHPPRNAAFTVEESHGYGSGKPTDADLACNLAPVGWKCTRPYGHSGPCAAEKVA